MTPQHPCGRTGRFSHAIVIVGHVVGAVAACGGVAAASEVLPAVPRAAESPVSVHEIADTIEVGTRGSGRTPRHAHGGACSGPRCSHGRCSHGACRHGGCEVPGCPANCPVRPASFGFYGTQWRTWPGQAPIEPARVERAAPVMPPKSEVPGADEESPVPGGGQTEEDPGAPGATDGPPRDREPSMLPPPDAERRSDANLPEEPGEPMPPEEKPADGKPATEKSDEANLFDEASLQRRGLARREMLAQVAVQQERLRREAQRRQEALLQHVPAAGAAVRQSSHVEPTPR